MKRTLPLIFWQLCLLPGANAFDDLVTLKDGRTIHGLVESGATGEIRINSAGIAVDQIQSIRFDSSVTLPMGQEISIRTIDPIDSSNADLNHEYAASLDDPVVVDGVEVVPASAKAVLRVTELQRSGITRRASLSTSLIAVIIDGRRLELNTDKVDSKSGSQAKRTAIGAGAGAGVGAAVGAGVGGAAGAGIGAGVGAVGGAVAGVLKGTSVKIATETRFTYKLTQQAVINDQGPALPGSVQTDTLTLRDGTNVKGSWVGMDRKQISFTVNNRPDNFPRSEVSAATFGPVPSKVVFDPITPPPSPPDTPPAPPSTVSLGQSISQVVAILGQPRNIADLGSKKIYTFPDLKVTFVDGKVTDIQ